MIRSVRLRLSLWYLGIFSLIFLVFGLALYHKVEANLFRDVDALLILEADSAVDTIFTLWKIERPQAGASGRTFIFS